MPFGHGLLCTAGTFQRCGYSVQSPQSHKDFGQSSNPLTNTIETPSLVFSYFS